MRGMANNQAFDYSILNENQRRVYDEITAGDRKQTPVPFHALLQSHELASRVQKLGEFVRYRTILPSRLSELAILIMARFWTAQYEWSVHKKEALKAGLDPAIIREIATRQPPHFAHPDEQVIYDFAVTLYESHHIPDDLYRRSVETLSDQGVVELVGLLGYYTLISMTLNVFEIDVPAGEQAELAP